MNYYQFHIGDFRSGTVNMSRQARWIYRDMLDIYYDTESPLPADIDVLLDMLGIESPDEKAIVEKHLRFKFSESEAGYTHEVCDKVITEYRAKAETARGNGRLGGRPKGKQNKPSGFQSGSDPVATANPVETGLKTNHKPLTINQEPEDQNPLPPDGDDSKGKKVSYSTIQSAYNEICSPTLPACLAMNESRKKQIRAMAGIVFDGAKPFTMGIEVWRQYFTDCLTNDHWCGKSEGGWRADFDFVTKPKNAIKLMERMN